MTPQGSIQTKKISVFDLHYVFPYAKLYLEFNAVSCFYLQFNVVLWCLWVKADKTQNANIQQNTGFIQYNGHT